MGRVRTSGFGENKSVLIFHHIAKCAGSTVERLLENLFEHSFQVHNSWDCSRVLEALDGPLAQADAFAVYGGGVAGIHHILPDDVDCYYVTILRDPFTRAVSHARFDRALGLSSDDDFEQALLAFPDVMVEALAAGHLELAVRRVEQEFLFVGFVEFMDQSVARLCRLIGLSDERVRDAYKAVNVSRAKKDIARPSQEFRRVHAKDYELYQAALSRFGNEITGLDQVAQASGTEYGGCLFSDTRQRQSPRDTAQRLRQRLDIDDGIALEDKLNALILALAEFDQVEGLKYYRRLVAHNPAFSMDNLGLDLPVEVSRELLYKAMADLPLLNVPPGDACYNRNRQMLLLRLAELVLVEKNLDEAESLYAEAHSLNPDNWGAARAYASMLRVAGDPEKGIEVLKALPDSLRQGLPFKLEILASAYQAGGLEGARRLVGELFDEESVSAAFDEVGFPESGSRSFKSLPDVESILIFKSGPDMVCEDLVDQVTTRWPDAAVDILSQPGASLLDKWRFRHVFLLPRGLFSQDDARQAMKDWPGTGQYDLAVIPTNGQMPIFRYDKFFEHAFELGIPLVGSYSLWNYFINTGKSMAFRNEDGG